jgi:hypothetical protein
MAEPGDLAHAREAVRGRQLERSPQRIDPMQELAIHRRKLAPGAVDLG